MTEARNVIYAVVVHRRWIRWQVVVPGIGRSTVFSRSRIEPAARELIEAEMGQHDAHVVVLGRSPGQRRAGATAAGHLAGRPRR